eukprot:5050782-Prymnesium_polylepis.1
MTWGRRRSGGRFPGLCAKQCPTQSAKCADDGGRVDNRDVSGWGQNGGGDLSLDTLPNSRNLDE